MSSFKKNVLSVYSVNLVNGLVGIAFIPLALKGIGVEGYAIYSIFIILTSYIFFVEMGVSKYFTKSIAQSIGKEKQKKEMQLAVGIYLRIAAILILFTPILLYIVPNYVFPVSKQGNIVEIIIILSVADYLLSIPVAILLTFNKGKENFIIISKYNLIAGLSRHLFLIIGVLVFKSVLPIIFIVLIRRLFDIIYAFKYLDPLPKGAWKPNYQKGEFKIVISQSILLSAAQLSQVTVLAVGTYLVNKNFTITEVGIYKSSFDMAAKVWFLSNGLGMVIFPRFAALLLDRKNIKVLIRKLMLFIRISLFAYTLFFVIAVLLVPYISNILLIKDLYLFYLLLYGVCLNAHTNLSYEFLQASSKLKVIILINFIILLLIIGSFYLLIDLYGIYSIAISWVISQFVYSLIMDYLTLIVVGYKNIFITLLLNILFFTLVILLIL
ncbi:oligosaccharide flippase family protein [Sporosarcina siberiensis]|uniref:Oligosaccharide flippase family protein n=1 Tax=Sporosarcina siberiensis TaxID=1365606 RepID=A0ABW4SJU1_9BACL